ncbi:MAG: EscU/YscU/HrcU family type III secretion system export apparatus switch protein, partial [Actinomycetota bacterium]|nr:EscU/YscU/HrcU family type III secretion system export apparatus switch protein [Actinomycetota bacterium]
HQLLGAWEGLFLATTVAMSHPSPAAARRLLAEGLDAGFSAALPLVGLVAAVSLVVSVGQVGLRASPKALWRPEQLSLTKGVRRLLSIRGLWAALRSSLELALLAVVGYLAVHRLVSMMVAGAMPLSATLGATGKAILAAVRYLALAGLVVAGADFAFQRRRLAQDLRMTKQEVKEEARRSEGSPELRRAVRSRQRKLSRSRMVAEVARSAVVVTNPTHLAVALAYERGVDAAPRVVAKGIGSLALAIRREARRHGVPVVEDRSLAWTIHAACEEGSIVPPHLYQAVAQVLAFVYSLTPSARSLLDTHRMARAGSAAPGRSDSGGHRGGSPGPFGRR